MQSFHVIDIIFHPISISKKTANHAIRPNDWSCTSIVFKDLLLTLFPKLYHQYNRRPEETDRKSKAMSEVAPVLYSKTFF